MSHIRVENLKYKYPTIDTFTINDISFIVNKGEFIGISGMNTAGKTTLCYTLTGLIPHFFKGSYGGNVFINDMEVWKHEVHEISASIGLVFENPFSQMSGAKQTVYDEIAFGLENRGVPRAEIHARVEDCMQQLDIENLQHKNPFELSGGQMQRVAIASVIAMKPDILILDEPTSQLDPQGSDEVFGVIENISKKGITIIMVDQKMEQLAKFSDRIFLIHNGTLIDSGTPTDLISRNNFLQYGVEPPIYSSFAQSMGLTNSKTGGLPITIEDMPNSGLENFIAKSYIDIECSIKTAEVIVSDLHFGYTKNASILNGITIHLNGSPTAIIGHNGAGKTTFVKLLKALIQPCKGEVLIDGVKTSNSTAAKLASTIGLVFQNPNDQIFKNNVLDEVMFGPLQTGQSKETARNNAIKMIDRVGLSSKINENPYDLSLAERKMITIASVLAMDTKIVIFDEPTMGQDHAGKIKLAEIIHGLYAEGKLVICITHDMDFVANTFEQTVILQEGRVLFDGLTREAFAQDKLLQLAKLKKPHITQLAQHMGFDGVILSQQELMT